MIDEGALQKLVDQAAIQQNINRYTEAASRADLELVGTTYAIDGVWELPAFQMKFEGRDAIKKAMADLLVPMEYLVQINSPAVIEVVGDRATARSTIREGAKFRDQAVSAEILGIYNDELVRTAEGWLYLAGIEDVFVCEIVGYVMGERMTRELTA